MIVSDKDIKKCEACGGPLKPSQYARLKREGEPAEKAFENLVCRNYPACPKAEKEIKNG
jgi:hypothetical protein